MHIINININYTEREREGSQRKGGRGVRRREGSQRGQESERERGVREIESGAGGIRGGVRDYSVFFACLQNHFINYPLLIFY